MKVYVDGKEAEYKMHEETQDQIWIKIDGRWRDIRLVEDSSTEEVTDSKEKELVPES